MDISNIGTVAAITVICFLVATIIKSSKLNNKWVPALCGLIGGILGIIGYYIMPDFPAQDILSAAAIGIISGLAATGVHQTCKQLRDNK